jgi:membrane protease YdiL (CAAX protease family)
MAPQGFRARTKEALRENRMFAAGELIVAVLIAVAGLLGIVPFSSTPFLLVFGWLSLWLRGLGWRSVGLVRPSAWARVLLLGVAAGVAYQYLSLYAVEPLLARLTGELPDVSMFAPLVGNARFLLLSLLVSWTLAAFGEELVYRGYLMNRIAGLFGAGRAGWALALALTSVLFGVVHLYQGASGIIATGLSGLVFGAVYLASGRNLWAPIITHGVYDTVGFTLIYLGKYPGM